MKNKIIKYMVSIGINPIKFVDFVNLGIEESLKQELDIIQKEEKSISIFDIILIFAIIIVGVFLAAIFL